MDQTTVQTDNGSDIDKAPEKESLFEGVVREVPGGKAVQILPGAKTSQSNVESFHGWVETELHNVEDLLPFWRRPEARWTPARSPFPPSVS